MDQIRRHPALLLLAAFVMTSVVFIACSGDPYGGGFHDQDGVSGGCVPGSVRRCRGPQGCLGEQVCLRNGKQYSGCVCTFRPHQDASADGSDASSNDAAGDAPSSNDAAGDAPSSNDAASDAPSSNDAAGDAPSSNDAAAFELPDLFR